MILNDEITQFIENIINNYFVTNDKKGEIFALCYTAVISAIQKNQNIENKWGYIRTVVDNILKDYVKEAYLERNMSNETNSPRIP